MIDSPTATAAVVAEASGRSLPRVLGLGAVRTAVSETGPPKMLAKLV
jgi:hypothetical protein